METGKYIVLRTSTQSDDWMARPPLLGPSEPQHAIELEVEVHDDLNANDVADLRNDPSVQQIAPDFPLKLHDPVSVQNGGEHEREQAQGHTWGLGAVGLDVATEWTGQGVTIAVLDTGIQQDHVAFGHLRDRVVTKNFTSEAAQDEDGHGTHCAGTIVGQPVDGMRIGVAPNAERVLIGKVLGLGGGSTHGLVNAIRWAADEGAHVISMSLGFDFTRFVAELSQQLDGSLEDEAILRAATSQALEAYLATVRIFETLVDQIEAQRGEIAPLFVAATGNDSRRDVLPSAVVGVAPPAAARSVLAVGAIGRADTDELAIAPFSNTGPNLVGPGVDVLSAGLDGGLLSLSGTSMATPHVAGLAALYVERQLQDSGAYSVQFARTDLEASGRLHGRLSGGRGDIGRGIPAAPGVP